MTRILAGLLFFILSLSAPVDAGQADPAQPALEQAREQITDLRMQLDRKPLSAAEPVKAARTEPAKPSFEQARQQIADIRKQLDGTQLSTAELAAFRDQAGVLAERADSWLNEKTPELREVDARLAELGPAPAADAPAEASDMRAQRKSLNARRVLLDAEIKRAKLLGVDVQQLVGEIADARRERFKTTLSQRVSTPLLPDFWRNTANLGRETERLQRLREQLGQDVRSFLSSPDRLAASLLMLLGAALLLLSRRSVEYLLLRRLGDDGPRRSWAPAGLAVAIALLGMLVPGFAAQLLRAGLLRHDNPTDSLIALSGGLVVAAWFAGLVHGLGRALLMPMRPQWRLAPISDALASQLRLFPLWFALAIAVGVMVDRLNSVSGSGLGATITTSFVIAVLYNGLIGWLLRCIQVANRRSDATIGAMAPRPAWAKLAFSLTVAAVGLGLLGAATGYLALAEFVGRQIIWFGIVAIAFYLLARLIDDFSRSVVSSEAGWARNASGMGQGAIDQISILLSGLLRLLLFLFTLVLLLVPFESSPTQLLHRGFDMGSGLKIGAFHIDPASLVPAVMAFVLGFIALRALQRWLAQRYLPSTGLDAGIQSSIVTLLGYVGAVIVLSIGLSSLGIPVERITWIASALSVGIGFGLQAIVQNFISGVILLVERPVKVGDLVAIGDVQGDIRRINVRATEIQLSDRSTLIVPNSEFITKVVRNISLANAEGRIHMRLPLPMTTDARRARQVMLQAIAVQPDILATPAPAVLLDGIEANMLMFTVVAFVASPRVAGGVRSELLFEILARLAAEEIALTSARDLRLQVQRRPRPAVADDDVLDHD
ncbi:MAG: DUF3772 domain-containing protein [Dokdonella sp.]